MSLILFADADAPRGLMPFLQENWLLLMPPVLGFVAIYLLLPKARRAKPIWGGVLAALALILGAAVLVRTDASWQESILFYAFAGIAVVAGVMMITQSNPVHAALSFALVVLSTCGLFLLLAAPFLMAATIIVYAGAIVVTFLFVIMLAQQEGVSNADQRSREPFLASLAGCVLLTALLCVLQKNYNVPDAERVLVDGMVHDLARLRDAQDDAAVKEVLGDPKKAEIGKRTRPLVDRLKERFRDAKIQEDSDNLQDAWNTMRVDEVRKSAGFLYAAVTLSRNRHGSLALDSMVRKLALLKDAKDDADVKNVLGDPKKALIGQGTITLVDDLKKHFNDAKIQEDSDNLLLAWNRMKVEDVKKSAGFLYAAVKTPGHFAPGQLPARNVAAIGKTLFTDYLVPVELAATLLLVATIGAIAIAGRKSEGLR